MGAGGSGAHRLLCVEWTSANSAFEPLPLRPPMVIGARRSVQVAAMPFGPAAMPL
jgi:hypothetical protein